jgi:hypothetical protein
VGPRARREALGPRVRAAVFNLGYAKTYNGVRKIKNIYIKNAVFWEVRRVALVRTDVSEELSTSIMTVTRIGELGTLAVTSNR